ncbi:acyl-CoA dehydrogenase [Halomicroarcula sp. F28]|uniref:acyl-CoA dehydrogenase n=1 Tax=Haloarcula salinisoli TaxID=2487746 RepID=UPI001C72D1A0|nr:acyl-CoA dehydrogenase [Halomicroarcula salinisoli]MBX0288335.1 acyl-CoA dehydrogenase [Halomicroarcula salinisoli]
MTNFKSGSGNLDFDEDDSTDESQAESSGQTASSPERDERSPEGADSSQATASDQSPADHDPDVSRDGPAGKSEPGGRERYPYFVRRSNVGDERDTRLEIHVRDKVADGEAAFRHELAAELDANDVSKTDAREFALLAAFRHPERVAELMREEGFDSLG